MMMRGKLFITGLVFLGFVSTVASGDITDGLISHWTFDEGSGTMANDSAGTNNGTLVNGPVWTSGIIGGAISFDGVNDYVNVGTMGNFGSTYLKECTVSLWVKSGVRNRLQTVVGTISDGVATDYTVALNIDSDEDVYEGAVVLFARDEDGSSILGAVNTDTGITDGQWHHLAVVLKKAAGIIEIYLDGQAQVVTYNRIYTGVNFANFQHPLVLGAQDNRGTIRDYFNGSLDEVMIFNRALSAEEIRELYQVGNTMPIANAGGNQKVYAWIDGIAEVCLDGSGSFDADGDELTYLWTWTVNNEPCSVTGVNPVINLPAAEYIIQLIVNDGYEDSRPNEVTITVIEPIEVELQVMPKTLNPRGQNIIAMIRMPKSIDYNDIDCGEKLILYPGGIKAEKQLVLGGRGPKAPVSILAFFNRAEFVSKVEKKGIVEVDIVGKLKSGRYFHGTDSIRVISKR